jgi:hypothetical protein
MGRYIPSKMKYVFYVFSSFFLQIFFYLNKIISLESWVTIMYYIQDAHSFWDWIYFFFLIVVDKNIYNYYSHKHLLFCFIYERSVHFL